MSTLTQLTEQHPETSRAILKLITHPTDRQKLRDLLGSCTCTNDSLICTSCPVIYTPPKGTDYSGHTPGEVE
jgi:hypothetical protein